jgi:hypothetical protein
MYILFLPLSTDTSYQGRYLGRKTSPLPLRTFPFSILDQLRNMWRIVTWVVNRMCQKTCGHRVCRRPEKLRARTKDTQTTAKTSHWKKTENRPSKTDQKQPQQKLVKLFFLWVAPCVLPYRIAKDRRVKAPPAQSPLEEEGSFCVLLRTASAPLGQAFYRSWRIFVNTIGSYVLLAHSKIGARSPNSTRIYTV